MRRLSLVALFAAGGAGATLLAAACLRPTQITVVITTDLPCAQYRGVTFAVGRIGELENRAPSMTTTECTAAGTIGSIVVVPSGDDDGEIAFKVVAGNGRGAEQCVAPGYGPQCIVARRALRFIPHAPLTVPITMRASCDGIPCGPSETCVFGLCRSATIPRPEDCEGSGCGEEVLVPAGPGPGPGDGGAGEGGVRDGGSEGGSDAQPPIAEGGTGACEGVAGFQVGAPWPVRGGCSTHASYTSVIGPPAAASVKWSVAIGLGSGTPDTSAVVGADGTIFVGGDKLRAIAPDGATKWSNGGAVQTTPALGVDSIYVVDEQQTLVARTFDGVVKWSTSIIPGSKQCSPNIGADGTVYISATSGGAGAVAPDGGARWGFDGSTGVPFMIQSPAVGADGTIYGGAVASGSFSAYLPTDGGVKWAASSGTPTLHAPVVNASGVSFNPTQFSLNAWSFNGSLLWTFTDAPGGGQVVSPALGPAGTLVITRSNEGVLGLHDQRDGGELWKVAVSPGALGHPLVDGEGTIYIGTATNEVVAIRSNRSTKWRVTVGGVVGAPLAMGADGTIYAVAGDGKLYAIR